MSSAPAPKAAEGTQADGTPGPSQCSLKAQQASEERNDKNLGSKSQRGLAWHQNKLKKIPLLQEEGGFLYLRLCI